MQIFYTPDIAVNPELPEEEAGHCIRVLRLTEGAEILLTDGSGSERLLTWLFRIG